MKASKMKEEEIIICDYMHDFVNQNWEKINQKKCEITKSKAAFLKEVKTDIETALWVFYEVCNWGMDRDVFDLNPYLKELWVETPDDCDYTMLRINDKYIKVVCIDKPHDYHHEVCFTEPQLNGNISFLVPHLIGNPVDAIDCFVQLIKTRIQKGDYKEALSLIDDTEKSLEDAKQQIDDFRNGKYGK